MGRPKQSRLVFFRVNAPHWWGKGVKSAILERTFSLDAGRHGEYKKRKWYTGEASTLRSGRMLFKLGKAREDLTHGTVQIDEGHYVFPEEGEGPVVPTVRCLYDPARSLLISETSSEIGWHQIKGSLEVIAAMSRTDMQKAQEDAGDIGRVVLSPILQSTDFSEWASSMDSVNSISFKFWPTNPSAKKAFENWDEAQREAKSEETRLSMRNKGSGLKVDAGLVETGLAQVQAGYGTASAIGKSGSFMRSWHSARKLVLRLLPWVDDKDELEEAWLQAADDVDSEDGHAE